MRIFILLTNFIFIILTLYNSNVLLLFKNRYKSTDNFQSVECFTLQSRITSTPRQYHQHKYLPIEVLVPVGLLKRITIQEQFVILMTMKNNYDEDVIISWELDIAKRIRQEVTKRMNEKQQESSSSPYMVGIVGIPGSGKTTGAQILRNLLLSNDNNNSNNNATGDTSDTVNSNGSSTIDATTDNDIGNVMILPFDGYHIPLNELNGNKDLIYRRGAPDTFDLQRFTNDLSKIRYGTTNNDAIILLPSFSHSIGDPEYDTIIYNRLIHTIVICEGLYLLHNTNGWEKIKSFFDICIYIDSNIDVCMNRLKIRNLQIPGYTPDEIIQRVDIVDRTNAVCVEQSRSRADLIVQSITSSSSTSTTLATNNPA